ncbi:MAG: DUF192 domain-containing protein [Alphaproteobacteria bacterium]
MPVVKRPQKRIKNVSWLIAVLGLLAVFGGIFYTQFVDEAVIPSLSIITQTDKEIPFQITTVSTPETRNKGLMFQKTLPQNAGMLFDFSTDGKGERPVAFWMKNTFIPLDIIFISAQGEIRHIAENTAPFSEKYIPSNAPIIAVLEINAGLSKTLNIQAGDQVKHPLFKE